MEGLELTYSEGDRCSARGAGACGELVERLASRMANVTDKPTMQMTHVLNEGFAFIE